MRTTIALLLTTLAVSGCATPPQWLADWHNAQDPCQSRGQPNYQYPTWCGAGSGRMIIRDSRGQIMGTIMTTK